MNITRKGCNTNDTDLCCTQVARELHAKLGAQHASCWSAAPQDVRVRRGLPVRVAFALGHVAFRPNHRCPPDTEAAPPHSAMPDTGPVWGFCTIRSTVSACRRRVAALMVQFPPFDGALDMGRARPCASYAAIPPFGGGEAAVRGSVAPKVQTTSAKNADNGVSWARSSALWAQRCPAWCVARMRTR